jgi:hypothetical protein
MGCPIAQRFSKSGFKAAAHDLDRMIKIKRLGSILLLIGIAGLMGYWRRQTDNLPKNRAPFVSMHLTLG